MISVEVMVLAGVMPSSMAITIDAIATANKLRARAARPPAFSLRLSGSGARRAKGWLTRGLDDSPRKATDVVVVPGLGHSTEMEVQARMQMPDVARARTALKKASAEGCEIATSCSGSFVLASAGLLNNRRATTSWWLAPLFRKLYPAVEMDHEALVVRDGPFTTAGAAMGQMDLMLSLIARHADAGLADQCSRYLLLDQRRSQARYMALSFLSAGDPRVARAEAWARKRLAKEFSVDELSAAVGLAPRTFARRVQQVTGLSPVRFVQRLRVEAAMALLETTRLPIDEVARRVGYSDPTILRRLIRRDAGRTPRELRAL